MRRRDILTGLAAVVPAGASAALMQAGDLTGRVRQLAADYEAAWNASDMAAMTELYAPDVHWVNVVGMHWQGVDEVDYAHRRLFEQSFRGVRQTLEEIESIVPLPGGGVVAVIRWTVAAYRTPAGATMPPSRTRMSLTLVPSGGTLRIAHGANIQVVEPAQASDPVRQRREHRSNG